MDIQTLFQEIRKKYTIQSTHQGIKKDDVDKVLKSLGKYSEGLSNYVWAMLDDNLYNMFNKNFKFYEGATVAHTGSYVGILMNGNYIKDDRETVRDYCMKPLEEIGGVEKVTYLSAKNKKTLNTTDGFFDGHFISRSNGSSYKLVDSFVKLLKSANNPDFSTKLKIWASEESKKQRLDIRIKREEENRKTLVIDDHNNLIRLSIELYAKHFLTGYEVIYIDASDGDRVTKDEEEKLKEAGIVFGNLDNVWPDVLLHNKETNSLWFIEAVTSDGEVDFSKMKGLKKICDDSNKHFGGATTTYFDYKTFAKRQDKEKNLVTNSFVWIENTPDKVFKIE